MAASSREPGLLRLVVNAAPVEGLRVREWRYAAPRGIHTADATAHPEIEIACVQRGLVRYRIGRRTVDVAPGQVIVVPAGVEHTTAFVRPTDARAIRLSADRVADTAATLDLAGRRLAPGLLRDASRAASLVELIAGETAQQGPGQHRALASLSEVLAIELLRAVPGAERPAPAIDPRIAAALRFVERSFQERVSVDDLARAARMSRYHFSRRFREALGQSPYQYLLERRLQRAATLLGSGEHSVTEAALCAGFTELGRFSRMFRAYAGQTPTEYRRGRAAPPVVGDPVSAAVQQSKYKLIS